MAGRLDIAKNYLLSVAERSIGIARAREYYNDTKPESINPDSRQPRGLAITGAMVKGIMQGMLPSIERFSEDELNGIRLDKPQTEPYEYTVSKGLGLTTGSVLDLATTTITIGLASHNIAEAIAFRFAANAASQVLGDVAVKAVDKIQHFRPPTISSLTC